MLQMLYSVQRERLLTEEIDYGILFELRKCSMQSAQTRKTV